MKSLNKGDYFGYKKIELILFCRRISDFGRFAKIFLNNAKTWKASVCRKAMAQFDWSSPTSSSSSSAKTTVESEWMVVSIFLAAYIVLAGLVLLLHFCCHCFRIRGHFYRRNIQNWNRWLATQDDESVSQGSTPHAHPPPFPTEFTTFFGGVKERKQSAKSRLVDGTNKRFGNVLEASQNGILKEIEWLILWEASNIFILPKILLTPH